MAATGGDYIWIRIPAGAQTVVVDCRPTCLRLGIALAFSAPGVIGIVAGIQGYCAIRGGGRGRRREPEEGLNLPGAAKQELTMSKKQKTNSKQSRPTSVVTGAAGFLGSNLVDLLLSRGHKVIGIDNFVTGSVDNIAHLGGHPHFKFIQQDVTEFIFLDVPVDYVWHFASPASPIDYLELPIQTLKVGSLGTHKALGLAKIKKARFLLASTSEIYGDPLVHPQTEDYWGNVNPVGPRGCYDEAKRFAEALTMAYRKEHGVETRIVRIFNTYGPRMRLHDGRVVPAFLSQALKNQPLTVFGDGKQTRSFCFVSDLIEGIYRLMMGSYGLPMNIGNPTEMTVLEFARQIIRATGSRSRIVFKPLPQDDPKQRRPDITLARTRLKWRPWIQLDAGLAKTIEYFRARV
jgi:dTDP-glucose 4,6-dehydratase